MKHDSERVFYFFEKISGIPRGSGNEKAVSDYIADFAKSRKLFCIQDSSNNLIIKKAASAGFEKKPPVIIQGHLDMVCEKSPDSKHDFTKDPIKLIYKDDYIYADNTTLGGDDGIAVAMGLALLDDNTISHPPIEVVFTTDEETGMSGAANIDCSNLEGKTIINIDSEAEGIFTVSCSGGMKTVSEIPVNTETISGLSSYKIEVSHLKGGHSGIDIDKNRANANRLMARILLAIEEKIKYRLNTIGGGAKDNAIPHYAYSVISAEESDFEAIKEICLNEEKIFKSEYKHTDNNISVSISETMVQETAFSQEDKIKTLTLISLMPNGVISLSTDIDGLVETSNNLGVVSFSDNKLILTCALRSSVISKKYFLYEQIRLLTELAGGKASYHGNYPAWEYKDNSPIRELFVKTYREMFSSEPKTDIIHAGLECGIFSGKIKNADIISFGPNIIDIHTPNEHISISSVERMWSFLLKILASM